MRHHHPFFKDRLMEHSFFGRRAHDHRRGGRHGFFGKFGGLAAGAAGLRAARMLSGDDLQLVILQLLKEKERHGYEIIKALADHSSGIYTPSPGMVYPALTYLEETGMASSETSGQKKLYRISPQGEAFLKENAKAAQEISDGLKRFGEKMAHMRDQAAHEEQFDENFSHDRGQSREDWRQMKSDFRELKEELKSALFEKLGAPAEEKKRVLEILKRAINEIRGE